MSRSSGVREACALSAKSVDGAELVGRARLTGVFAVLPFRRVRAAAKAAGAITRESHLARALDQLSDDAHERGFRKPSPVDHADAPGMHDRLERRLRTHTVLLGD